MKKTDKQKLFEAFEKVCGVKLIKENLENINELELDDYSKLMNKTHDYPWMKYLGDEAKSDKYENINKLANILFKREFYNKYPIGLEIRNGNTIYKFRGIGFNTNYTSYGLSFENEIEGTLDIIYDKSNGYYIKSSKIENNLDEDSKKLVIEMLKYNEFKI
jgi:hypothetical protein